MGFPRFKKEHTQAKLVESPEKIAEKWFRMQVQPCVSKFPEGKAQGTMCMQQFCRDPVIKEAVQVWLQTGFLQVQEHTIGDLHQIATGFLLAQDCNHGSVQLDNTCKNNWAMYLLMLGTLL